MSMHSINLDVIVIVLSRFKSDLYVGGIHLGRMAVGTGGGAGGQLPPPPQYFANQKYLRVLK